MSFFPEYLYLNPYTGELSDVAVDNLTDGMPIAAYKLSKVLGYKAYYCLGSTKLMVVVRGNKFTVIN